MHWSQKSKKGADTLRSGRVDRAQRGTGSVKDNMLFAELSDLLRRGVDLQVRHDRRRCWGRFDQRMMRVPAKGGLMELLTFLPFNGVGGHA